MVKMAFSILLILLPLLVLTKGNQPCPSECRCEASNRKLVCTGTNTLLQKGDLQFKSLAIENTSIPNLDENYFKYFLQLTSLAIRSSSLRKVDSSAFLGLQELLHLDLSSNKLTRLDSTFSNLGNLRTLDLHNNTIVSLSSRYFEGLNGVTHLDLSFNKLQSLDSDAFYNARNITVLLLNNNDIYAISGGTFKPLRLLKSLNLENNKLINVEGIFTALAKLAVLKLGNNDIPSISSETFRDLPALKTLLVQQNSLVVISNDAFHHLKNLQLLNLSYNQHLGIDNPFKNSKQLRLLDLSGSIQAVQRNAFLGLDQLETLLMSHNRMSDANIENNAFDHLSHLATLDLSYNNFTRLTDNILSPLHMLKLLYINSNPWVCACGTLQWAFWVRNIIQDPQDVTCTSPSSVYSKPILDVLGDSTCAEVYHYQNLIIMVKVGNSAILRCPRPGSRADIHWNKRENIYSKHVIDIKNAEPVLKEIDEIVPVHNHINHTNRIQVLANGNLLIRFVLPSDSGIYACDHPQEQYNASARVILRLNYNIILEVKTIGSLIGFITAFSFMLLSALVVCLKSRSLRLCKRKEDRDSKAQQLKHMMINMEAYRHAQMLRLREHYAGQIEKLRTHCSQQAERMRDNYASQMSRVRHYKESKMDSARNYRHTKMESLRSIRDNYTSQVGRLREYSSLQIVNMRESYVAQMNKLRDYSYAQMKKLERTYKLQQKHIISLMETFSIDNCKLENADRVDSVSLFDAEFTLETFFASTMLPFPDPLDDLAEEGEEDSLHSATDNMEYDVCVDAIPRTSKDTDDPTGLAQSGIGVNTVERMSPTSEQLTDVSEDGGPTSIETIVEVNTCKNDESRSVSESSISEFYDCEEVDNDVTKNTTTALEIV